MRRIIGAFLIVVACLSPWSLVVAEDMDSPFALPVNDFRQTIPDGDGMAFFYGNWRNLNRSGPRVMSVSPDAFIGWGSDSYPYRVLYEAKNYVLVAELLRPYPKKKPVVAWTNFVVITLSHSNGDDPYSKYASMRQYRCSDPSMDGGGHAFSWSRERLLEVFKSSRCLRLIRPNDTYAFLSFPGGIYIFQRRIPD
jgi:hypothetical protein